MINHIDINLPCYLYDGLENIDHTFIIIESCKGYCNIAYALVTS
jgi:hypothetical protein